MASLLIKVTWLPGPTVRVFGLIPAEVIVKVSEPAGATVGVDPPLSEPPHAAAHSAIASARRWNALASEKIDTVDTEIPSEDPRRVAAKPVVDHLGVYGPEIRLVMHVGPVVLK